MNKSNTNKETPRTKLVSQIHNLIQQADKVMSSSTQVNHNEKRMACEYALCIVLDFIKWSNFVNEMPISYVMEKYRRLTFMLKQMGFLTEDWIRYGN